METKRKALDDNATIKVKEVKMLPVTGTWLPVSVVAYLSKYTRPNIERLYKNKIIRSIRFPKGPILLNYNDLEDNWLRNKR